MPSFNYIIYCIIFSIIFTACGDFATEIEKEPPSEGFTQWKSIVDLEEDISAAALENRYTSIFEGRNDNGKIQYRAFFADVPSDVFTYLVYYNLTEDEYESVSSELEEQEFTQISYQTFKNNSNAILSQSVWINYTSSPRSQFLDNPNIPTE